DHIGGIQVALVTTGAQLFFDLGLAQMEHSALFNAALPVREGHGVLIDYLRSGMAPLIDGFYRSDELGGSLGRVLEPANGAASSLSDAPVFPSSGARGVFMSHLHSDHAALLRFLDSGQT